MHGRRSNEALPSLTSGDLQRLLEGLADAAVVVDRNLRPVAWNRAYVHATGLRPRRFERVVNEPETRCRDLIQLGVCDDDCLLKRTLETGAPVRLDEISARPMRVSESNEHVFIVNAIPLKASDGDFFGIIEIYRDVTAEVRIQARYKVLLERERQRAELLEEEVRHRTADLERSLDELRRTRHQLVQSEKLSSLGRLVAGLAHELNNPINFVYGNAGFLQDYVEAFRQVISEYERCALSPEHAEQVANKKAEVELDYVTVDVEKVVDAILSGAQRASGIIQDLRKFIYGGTDAQKSDVDVKQAVLSTINLVSHEFRDRITLRCTGEDELPPVQGNEGQLNQVFMNLIVNAVEAIDGPGEVNVDVVHDGGGIRVDVTDTGPGIEPEHMDQIFEPFFTTKPVGKGTGLGLSISYSIVGAHGGSLSARSEPGRGATFTVWLPFAGGSASEAAER